VHQGSRFAHLVCPTNKSREGLGRALVSTRTGICMNERKRHALESEDSMPSFVRMAPSSFALMLPLQSGPPSQVSWIICGYGEEAACIKEVECSLEFYPLFFCEVSHGLGRGGRIINGGELAKLNFFGKLPTYLIVGWCMMTECQ